MTSRRALAATAVACAAVAAVPARADAAIASPTRIQVSAREFSYVFSRLRIPTGPFVMQLVNFGEDDHNLYFRRVGGTKLYRVPITNPGGVTTVRSTFWRAGTYRAWCGLPGHRMAGMRATFTVVRL